MTPNDKSIEEVRTNVLADFTQAEIEILQHLQPALKEIGLSGMTRGVSGPHSGGPQQIPKNILRPSQAPMWDACSGLDQTRLDVANEILAAMPEGTTVEFGETKTWSGGPAKLHNLPRNDDALKQGMAIHENLWGLIQKHGSVREALAHMVVGEAVRETLLKMMDDQGIADIKQGFHDEMIFESKYGPVDSNSDSQMIAYQLEAMRNWPLWASDLPSSKPLLIEDFNTKPLTKKQRAESYISKRTADELETEVDQLRKFVVDVLLPAKFQDKPNTWLRARLQAVKKSGQYNHLPIVSGAITTALKNALVVQYMTGVFSEIIAAVEGGKDLPRE